jgi:hypothetical protein
MLNEKWNISFDRSNAGFLEVPADAGVFSLDRAGRINLDVVAGECCKPLTECVVYNEFELDDDGEIAFGFGADWWCEIYLNGEKVFSNLNSDTGNNAHSFTPNDNYFSCNGKKGRNLLAVMIRRGSAGSWYFAFGKKDIFAIDPVYPCTILVNPEKITGTVKCMNAVNNGPIKERNDQCRGNMRYWKAAKIPFARNHDAAFCASYGGEHSVDIQAIFPDFSKDVNDPASYDFTLTDRYILQTLEGGTETFYRLGSKIEHLPKKYGTCVPADFQKWAEICEHIIRHYNEGWADGFEYNIRYWEIWNEPDLNADDEKDKKTWQGTEKEFFELYKVAACHLKKCFPALKIGGPALAWNFMWAQRFLASLTENGRTPLDFFSWHCYTVNPSSIGGKSNDVREMLDRYGYTDTESILNEWNYVRNWTDQFIYSIQQIIGLKGAVFTASCMCSGQNSPLDMLMYYDARPCAFNGLFDFYTYAPLKGYYAFIAWSKLVELGKTIAVDTGEKKGIYAVGAADGEGKCGLLLCRYFEEDDLPADLPLTIDVGGRDLSGAKLFLLDEERNLEEVPVTLDAAGNMTLAMKANTVAYLEF